MKFKRRQQKVGFPISEKAVLNGKNWKSLLPSFLFSLARQENVFVRETWWKRVSNNGFPQKKTFFFFRPIVFLYYFLWPLLRTNLSLSNRTFPITGTFFVAVCQNCIFLWLGLVRQPTFQTYLFLLDVCLLGPGWPDWANFLPLGWMLILANVFRKWPN
jgi:hypothetical protein